MNKPVDAAIVEQKFLNFFKAALQDEALLSELMAAVDSKDDAAIMAMARQHGYNFSQESIREGLKRIVNLVAPIVLLDDGSTSL